MRNASLFQTFNAKLINLQQVNQQLALFFSLTPFFSFIPTYPCLAPWGYRCVTVFSNLEEPKAMIDVISDAVSELKSGHNHLLKKYVANPSEANSAVQAKLHHYLSS